MQRRRRRNSMMVQNKISRARHLAGPAESEPSFCRPLPLARVVTTLLAEQKPSSATNYVPGAGPVASYCCWSCAPAQAFKRGPTRARNTATGWPVGQAVRNMLGAVPGWCEKPSCVRPGQKYFQSCRRPFALSRHDDWPRERSKTLEGGKQTPPALSGERKDDEEKEEAGRGGVG